MSLSSNSSTLIPIQVDVEKNLQIAIEVWNSETHDLRTSLLGGGVGHQSIEAVFHGGGPDEGLVGDDLALGVHPLGEHRPRVVPLWRGRQR